MANKMNTVLYAGVTSDLKKRVFEHREGILPGFTKTYQIKKLVYYEVFDSIESAICREKQIKAGSKRDKIGLILSMNRGYRDLYDEILQ